MIRSLLPSHLDNPFRTAWQVLRSGHSAAYSAVGQMLLGVVAMPLDFLLRYPETRRYSLADKSKLPIVFVCGPPRSGTTLATQVLLESGHFGYFNNLMSMFPNGPITANKLFGRYIGKRASDFSAYYGKTRSLSGPNDSLYLWDRWFGPDRDHFPSDFVDPDARESMTRFFGAWETFSGRPLLTKNNRLNGFAGLVAPHLPNALFICMRREPIHLAQSLYIAREQVTQSLHGPYGAVGRPYMDNRVLDDPVRDVCRQVQSYEDSARLQQAAVGSERFWRVSYEEFCTDPARWIRRVGQFLDETVDGASVGQIGPFPPSRATRLPNGIVNQMASECAAIGLEMTHPYFA